MTTGTLLRGPVPRSDTAAPTRRGADRPHEVLSFGSAVRPLLGDARMGRVGLTAPGDRWLIRRIEEALRGFDEIQAMAAGDEPEAPTFAGGAGTALILTRRARASV